MKYIHENISMPKSVLDKLPPRRTLGPFVEIEDYHRKPRKAVTVFWMEENPMGGSGCVPRKGYFCVETGEYLTEAL